MMRGHTLPSAIHITIIEHQPYLSGQPLIHVLAGLCRHCPRLQSLLLACRLGQLALKHPALEAPVLTHVQIAQRQLQPSGEHKQMPASKMGCTAIAVCKGLSGA